jgi:DNA-binding transcriptional ArsR family regulator
VAVKGDGRFDWETLVPLVVHPLKVTAIEALEWIGQPLSASDLTKIIDDEKMGLSHVSYHLNRLGAVGALKVVRRRQVRGSVEKFYFFR